MARILLVDDDKPLLEMMQATLAARGHEVTATDDPVRAFIFLADALRPVPDLLISDVMMRGLDGLSLAKRVQNEERLKSLKILIVTGSVSIDDSVKKAPYVAGFLSKPFLIDSFHLAVSAALAK
ncbi:MAG: response regulator [Elusimicrobia bacterium]|nr:response regulator [Elusimicrobiota bacterium]